MTGLDLSRQYWETIGKPAFASASHELLEHAAVGLVGEGSECFGFDDEISRDHDWGPGFCLWFTTDDMARFGETARRIYSELPQSYLCFQRLHVGPETAHRVGVQEIPSFFARYIGFSRPPQSVHEWRAIPETGLSVVTNGQVWQDPLGEFSSFRATLLNYYPEELRRKKLAAACALAAQSGQYNYSRCMRRNETVAAFTALSEFIIQSQKIIFLLNRRYAPYYKWTHHALCTLPVLGQTIGPKLRLLADMSQGRAGRIEEISADIIAELRKQGLSSSRSDFLLDHGYEIQSRITDPELARLHLMAE